MSFRPAAILAASLAVATAAGYAMITPNFAGRTEASSVQQAPTTALRPSVEKPTASRPTVGPRANPPVVSHTGSTVRLKDFGAKCDGIHDDRPAIDGALIKLDRAGGGVLEVPNADCRFKQTARTLMLGVGSNILIRGVGARSAISMTCDSGTSYREMFRIFGDNVALQNISLVRASACSGLMLGVRGVDNLSLTNVRLDGRAPAFAGSMHGIVLMDLPGGYTRGLKVVNSKIQNLSYGLLQPNEARTVTDKFLVDNCEFSGNTADDLEFNAPNTTMTGITVRNSRFSDNRSNNHSSGFGIGLANVKKVNIVGNTFTNYAYEPIHIEDNSSNIVIRSNTFRRSYTATTSWSSHVFIISGSHGVVIEKNLFDTTSNRNSLWAVYAGPGGSGRAYPHTIKISSNHFVLSSQAKALYAPGVSGVVLSGNRTSKV